MHTLTTRQSCGSKAWRKQLAVIKSKIENKRNLKTVIVVMMRVSYSVSLAPNRLVIFTTQLSLGFPENSVIKRKCPVRGNNVENALLLVALLVECILESGQ